MQTDIVKDCAAAVVRKVDVIKVDLPFEARRRPRAAHVANLHIGLEYFANAYPAHRRFRDRVGHLRKLAHRFVHLAEIKQENQQLSRRKVAGHHQPRAIPEHKTRPGGDDYFDQRRQFRFQAARLKRCFHAGETFLFEPLLFIVFARESFDDAN